MAIPKPMRLIRLVSCYLACALLFAFIACGSNSSTDNNKPQPDFTLMLSSGSLSITAGTAQNLTVSATASNGFTGTINVTFSGMPSGVTANPSTASLTPGTPQTIKVSAAANAAVGSASVAVNGVSGSLSHMATLALTINAIPPPVGVDVTTYHYDNGRDGLNPSETTLTLANVKSTNFGKINFFETDGKVDAEPLYLSQLSINGGTHN